MPRALSYMLLGLALAAGCAHPAPPLGPSPGKPLLPPTQSVEPVEPGPPKDVGEWLEYLTVEEKVGQLLWFGLPGPQLSAEAEALVREGKAGGFVLFDRQGPDLEAVRKLTGQLQEQARGRERFTPGLFITVDQEGGTVLRFRDAVTAWPEAAEVGAIGSLEYAEEVARGIARELRDIGVNLNLAPVADVNSNPDNPVIGSRAYGVEPDLVARMVVAVIEGFHIEQIGATAKHFPGHGDTHLDSHFDLPVIEHGRQRLEQVELVPFRAAIDAGVDAIMVAHVVFSAVEPEGLPATLSPKVVQGLLKDELGYKGLVITDAMDTMKAITDRYAPEQWLVMAVQAGIDVVLTTDSFERQAEYHQILLDAVRDGRISPERLDDAVRRNLLAKAKRGLLP